MKRIGTTLIALAMVLTGTVVAYAANQPQPALVDIDLKNVTIEQGVSALFAGTGFKYSVDPGVSGKIVELRLKGITFDQALNAFADAAAFTYTVTNGMYIIKLAAPKSQARQTSTTVVQQGSAKPAQPAAGTAVPIKTQQPSVQPAQQPGVVQGGPSQQVVVNQTAPVFYGQPGGNYGNGYGYAPPYYQAGNLGFLYGWPPVTLGGINPPIMSFGPGFPPPPGWVSPDMLRFLRTQSAITPGPYFSGYGY